MTNHYERGLFDIFKTADGHVHVQGFFCAANAANTINMVAARIGQDRVVWKRPAASLVGGTTDCNTLTEGHKFALEMYINGKRVPYGDLGEHGLSNGFMWAQELHLPGTGKFAGHENMCMGTLDRQVSIKFANIGYRCFFAPTMVIEVAEEQVDLAPTSLCSLSSQAGTTLMEAVPWSESLFDVDDLHDMCEGCGLKSASGASFAGCNPPSQGEALSGESICQQVNASEASMAKCDRLAVDVVNPDDSKRSYSSVWGGFNDPHHKRSMLNSPQAWSAAKNQANEWMQMDLGAVHDVMGLVTQGRKVGNHHHQRVKTVVVRHSIDGHTWADVPGGPFPAGALDEGLRVFFDSRVKARWIRIVVKEWEHHISMRAAVLVHNAQSPWRDACLVEVCSIGDGGVAEVEFFEDHGMDSLEPAEALLAGEYEVWAGTEGHARSYTVAVECDGSVSSDSGYFVNSQVAFEQLQSYCSAERDHAATFYLTNSHGVGKYDCLRQDGTTLIGNHYLASRNHWGAIEYRLIKPTSC